MYGEFPCIGDMLVCVCVCVCVQDVFSEEFVAQAQAKLDEAMQILSKEDPELWQQLKGFSDAASASLGCTEGEERGREGESGREGERKEGGESIEDTLEDTFRRLKESTERIEVGTALSR